MVVWIRLLDFPSFMYKKNVIKSIRERVGHVIKLDDNTCNAQRGHFVRLVVHVDLNKPLISKFKIDGCIQ